MWRDVSRTLRELWRIPGESAGAYRPDLHYMRGPGPKWHAKYGKLPKPSATADKTSTAIVRSIAGRRA